MNIDIYSIIGWGGMILIILAYFLLSIKKLKSNSVIYNLLNFFGALGILVNTFVTKSWPSVALNGIMMGIAIYSIAKKINTKPVYKELR
jgi:hypothetical protein